MNYKKLLSSIIIAFESGATYSQVMQQSLHKSVEGLKAYDQSDKRKNNAVNGLV